jgi:hypothetical protein
MEQEFPNRVGQVKLIYTRRSKSWNLSPACDQKRRIRLSLVGKPEIHLLESQPWVLYSHIRQYLPGHSRAYYCVGEENGRSFVARIQYGLWLQFTRKNEQSFLSELKPKTMAEAENKVGKVAERIGNLWMLPLPTNWVKLAQWASDTFQWSKIIPRCRKNFPLLGQNSGWVIKLGGYCRPWGDGRQSIAIAGGQVVCPKLSYKFRLSGPHLVGLVPGWQYHWWKW